MDEREQLLETARQSGSVIKELENCENKYLHLLEKETKFKKHVGWVWVGMILGSIIAVESLVSIFSGKQILGNLVGMLISAGLAALCVWRFMVHLNRKKLIAEANAELDRVQANPALSWLPPKYRITTYIYKMIEYWQNMRTKTLQEAINLLETEIHQQTMEELAAFGAING